MAWSNIGSACALDGLPPQSYGQFLINYLHICMRTVKCVKMKLPEMIRGSGTAWGGFSNADKIFFGKERVLQAPHSI